MTEIYFIRHSKFDPTFDKDSMKCPLTKEGVSFAKGKLNIEELKNIDVLYASEFLRAQMTADILSKYNNDLDINVTSLINERYLGDDENAEEKYWDLQYEDENAKCINGQSRKEVTDKMVTFINETLDKYKGKKIVAVCHAMAITFMLMNYGKLLKHNLNKRLRHIIFDNKDIVNGEISFCDIFKLTFDDNNKLIDINKI